MAPVVDATDRSRGRPASDTGTEPQEEPATDPEEEPATDPEEEPERAGRATPADAVRLTLYGAVHFDRPGKVTRSLDRHAAGADAVFLEGPEGGVTPSVFLRALLWAPLFFLGQAALSVVYTPLYVLLSREYETTETVVAGRVAEERSVPVFDVDDHPMQIVARAGPRSPWAIANWLLLAVAAGVAPTRTLTGVAVLAGLWASTTALHELDRRLWLVAAVPVAVGGATAAVVTGALSLRFVLLAVAVYAATVALTFRRRERHMVARVAEIARERGYDDVVLVAGRAHLPGLVRAARDTPLEVVRSVADRPLVGGVEREHAESAP